MIWTKYRIFRQEYPQSPMDKVQYDYLGVALSRLDRGAEAVGLAAGRGDQGADASGRPEIYYASLGNVFLGTMLPAYLNMWGIRTVCSPAITSTGASSKRRAPAATWATCRSWSAMPADAASRRTRRLRSRDSIASSRPWSPLNRPSPARQGRCVAAQDRLSTVIAPLPLEGHSRSRAGRAPGRPARRHASGRVRRRSHQDRAAGSRRRAPSVRPDRTTAKACIGRSTRGTRNRSCWILARAAKLAACLRDLIAASDVLVNSLRPGTLESWGLDEATLREASPRLDRHLRFGFRPDRARTATAAATIRSLRATAASAYLTGDAAGPPMRAGGAIPVCDFMTGVRWGARRVMSLYRRDRRSGLTGDPGHRSLRRSVPHARSAVGVQGPHRPQVGIGTATTA